MSIDPGRISGIVAEVLERLEAETPARGASATAPLGIHPDLDTAVAAARASFEAYDQVPLSTRNAVIASVRETLAGQYQTLARLAVDETGLGRVEDKILKNRIVTERTPGTEDLEPVAWTGDHGMTLAERAPYGVIATITPVTNPSETVINNGLSMIAGGNTVVFCPHPNARRGLEPDHRPINRAARRSAAAPLHSVDQPTLGVAKGALRYQGIRLNVVTSGPGCEGGAGRREEGDHRRARQPAVGGGRDRGSPQGGARHRLRRLARQQHHLHRRKRSSRWP
jgi:hypothetical protein